MKGSKWFTRLACGALILVTLIGAAIAAGSQGSQDDPLVTLGYLNEKAVPDILKQVDDKLKKQVEELEKRLQDKGQAGFVTVEAAKGKTVTVNAGTQLLLRSGSAACIDGLIDLTEGETLGGVMTANHLYIATKDGQKVAVSEKAAFMVLGGYSVK